MKWRSILLILFFTMLFLLPLMKASAGITVIKPVEAADQTLLLAYGENLDNFANSKIFSPSTIGEYPKAILKNVTIIVIPPKTPFNVVFQVQYGHLNTSNMFIPYNTQNMTYNVQNRAETIVFTLEPAKNYVHVRIAYLAKVGNHTLPLYLSFQYKSPESVIIEHKSLAEINQMLLQTLLVASIVAIAGVVTGALIARRVYVFVMPLWVYFVLFGVFVAASTVYALFGLSIALPLAYFLDFVLSIFIGAKYLGPDPETLYIITALETNHSLDLELDTVLLDRDGAIIYETFTDMILRILGVKTTLRFIETPLWRFSNNIVFAETKHISPPDVLPKNAKETSIWVIAGTGIIVSALMLRQNQLISGIVFALFGVVVAVIMWFTGYRATKGIAEVKPMERHVAEEIIRAMRSLHYTAEIAKKNVEIQYELYNERLETETKSFEKASKMNKKLLDVIALIVGLKGGMNGRNEGIKEITSADSNRERPETFHISNERAGETTSRAQQPVNSNGV